MAESNAVVFLIGSQPSLWAWLTPVLTFSGSVLLFGASMYGVWYSNRAASRRADKDRENERRRDFRLWQRDHLLRIADEIIQAGVGAHAECLKIRRAAARPSQQSLEPLALFAEKVTENEDRLLLIGAHDPAQHCAELREAIRSQELMDTIKELHHLESSGTDSTTQLIGKTAENQARQQELCYKFDDHRARIKYACKAVQTAVERELARHTN
jgi:hypothetical protein